MSKDSGERREGQLSRDRDTIREWAREHDATAVRETETESDSDRFRMVPKNEMTEAHEEVEWEEFFEQLDEGDRVVIFRADSDRKPFEIVGQNNLASLVDDEGIEKRLMKGETVTSTITETTVVESVVVEELTVESELVDTQVSNERVVDAELLRRECTDCELTADETVDSNEWFDTDRYLENVPSHAAGEPLGSTGTDSRGSATERSSTGTAERTSTTETEHTSSDTAERTSTTETEHTSTTATDQMSTDVTDQTDTTALGKDDTRETGSDPETAGMKQSTSESTRTSESDLGNEPKSGAQEFPFQAELEVEETWAVTRSFTEEFTVESAVTDTEVTEAETIEDYDIEIEGLHRSIVENGIIKEDAPTDEAMSDYEIESELAEQDRIITTFVRELTVEDEIVDKVLATARITEIQPLEMEVIRTKQLENVAATSADHEEAEMESGADLDAGEEASTDQEMEAEGALGADEDASAHSTAGEGAGSMVSITDDAIGNPVVNAEGERIGLVTEVEEEANALFIDPEPGITERIRSILGWGKAADDDYRLDAEKISRITDDEVELKSPEELK